MLHTPASNLGRKSAKALHVKHWKDVHSYSSPGIISDSLEWCQRQWKPFCQSDCLAAVCQRRPEEAEGACHLQDGLESTCSTGAHAGHEAQHVEGRLKARRQHDAHHDGDECGVRQAPLARAQKQEAHTRRHGRRDCPHCLQACI